MSPGISSLRDIDVAVLEMIEDSLNTKPMGVLNEGRPSIFLHFL